MARPTIYTQEVLEKTKEYLINYGEQGDTVPSVAGLASYLRIAKSTIYLWAGQDDKQEFSDIVARVLSRQGKTLINKGLDGKFNASIAKVMLSKHGYKEQTETDITSKGEQINTLDPKAVALAKEYEERLRKSI